MMIDSINIRIKRMLLPIKMQGLFNKGREVYINDELVTMNGNLGNLLISRGKKYITITGSLAAYYYGNNVILLDFETFKLAIDKLSRELEIDLSEANITSIDLALNVVSEKNIKLLFNYFGERIATNRFISKTSLYYDNHSIKIIVYDKTNQAFNKYGLTIDESVIRIEMRFKHKSIISFCKEQCIEEKLIVKHLFQQEIFEALINEWHIQYNSINKNIVTGINKNCISSPKKFKEAMFALGILAQGGTNKVIEFIENTRHSISIKRNEYISRIKRDVKKINNPTNSLTYDIDFFEFENSIKTELENNLSICQKATNI